MFIVNNSCEVFLESIELKSLNQIACNLATEHMESIVVEKGIQGRDYRSYQIAICLKRKSGFSTQVRVNAMAIFIGDETTTIPIWTKRYDDTFNKIAITENYNRFDVTVLLKPETKKKMIDHLNDNCKIVIDMNIELVSASYVSTKMQCRGEFIKTNSDNLENDFKLSGKEPMCFWNVVVETQSCRVATIDRNLLGEEADKLLKEIAIHSGSFEVEDVTSFVNGIKVTKLKAPSTDTTDISMQIQDVYTNLIRKVGFSIKSEVGHAPTLLNAGKTTNFIYKVDGISSEQAGEINAIETRTKIQDRMAKIREYGGEIKYVDMSHAGFKRNLIMVDSSMPEILGNILLYYYGEDVKDCKKLVELEGERDPLGYGDAAMYEYKFKKFLCSCALGLKPAKPWDGLDEANGGYIIVKADGEVLAYHIYNRNFFEQYLLDNTICERASTSRHEYMRLYEEDGQMYIKLNLQVRFK